MGLKLRVLPEVLAVCRLAPDAALPDWIDTSAGFLTISRTPDELSLVCDRERVPEGVRAERGWRAFKVEGPLDFALTGILAALAGPLADAGISIFAISTFDTDYLLVRESTLGQAIAVLRETCDIVENLGPDRPNFGAP
jgi:hypothetical protein